MILLYYRERASAVREEGRGACLGDARSTVVTSLKRPNGEATSGRDGEERKTGDGETAAGQGDSPRETDRERESRAARLDVCQQRDN